MSMFLPPHRDSETAALFGRVSHGNARLKWVVVRPDLLVDGDTETLDHRIFNGACSSQISHVH